MWLFDWTIEQERQHWGYVLCMGFICPVNQSIKYVCWWCESHIVIVDRLLSDLVWVSSRFVFVFDWLKVTVDRFVYVQIAIRTGWNASELSDQVLYSCSNNKLNNRAVSSYSYTCSCSCNLFNCINNKSALYTNNRQNGYLNTIWLLRSRLDKKIVAHLETMANLWPILNVGHR